MWRVVVLVRSDFICSFCEHLRTLKKIRFPSVECNSELNVTAFASHLVSEDSKTVLQGPIAVICAAGSVSFQMPSYQQAGHVAIYVFRYFHIKFITISCQVHDRTTLSAVPFPGM